jgi:hypothetical protein
VRDEEKQEFARAEVALPSLLHLPQSHLSPSLECCFLRIHLTIRPIDSRVERAHGSTSSSPTCRPPNFVHLVHLSPLQHCLGRTGTSSRAQESDSAGLCEGAATTDHFISLLPLRRRFLSFERCFSSLTLLIRFAVLNPSPLHPQASLDEASVVLEAVFPLPSFSHHPFLARNSP